MADNNDFKNTVETLFEGMEGFLQSKTVVGEAVHVGDTVVLPLVDVTFGVGAGANAGDRKYGNAGGGIGGRMSPSAMLVISNGTTKLVSVKSQDSVSKDPRHGSGHGQQVHEQRGRNTGRDQGRIIGKDYYKSACIGVVFYARMSTFGL